MQLLSVVFACNHWAQGPNLLVELANLKRNDLSFVSYCLVIRLLVAISLIAIQLHCYLVSHCISFPPNWFNIAIWCCRTELV